jgi:predicted amidohydrolase YtcJ
MTDHGAELVRADLVVRAAAVRTLGPGRRPQRALAVRGDRIAARLLGEEDLRGSLTPGRLADLTIWDRDPATCPPDELRDLNPLETLLGGVRANS